MAPANPYAVNFGSIPFAPSSFPTGMGDLASSYQANYGNALNFNKSLGNTINDLYGTTMQQQLQGQQGINNTIANYGQSARQAITDSTAQQQGVMQQSMIGRGLGNTTLLDAGTRGINYDAGKQNLQLDDQIAAMKAGYQNQFNTQNTALAGNQANFLERMSGAYPNADLYGKLAQMYGAAGQSAQNQGAYGDQMGRLQQAGQAGKGVMGGIGGGGGGQRQTQFGTGYFNPGTMPTYGNVAVGGGGVGVGATAYDFGADPYGAGGSTGTGYDDYGAYGWAGGPSLDTGATSDNSALSLYDEAGGYAEPPNPPSYGWEDNGSMSYGDWGY